MCIQGMRSLKMDVRHLARGRRDYRINMCKAQVFIAQPLLSYDRYISLQRFGTVERYECLVVLKLQLSRRLALLGLG
jgi:hypothetical protein